MRGWWGLRLGRGGGLCWSRVMSMLVRGGLGGWGWRIYLLGICLGKENSVPPLDLAISVCSALTAVYVASTV